MSPVESAPRSGALGTQFLKEIHEQPDALLRLLAHEKTIARAAQLAVENLPQRGPAPCELLLVAEAMFRLEVANQRPQVVRDRLQLRWELTSRTYLAERTRMVCYLSAEFLLGPHLGVNLAALDIEAAAREAVRSLGFDLDALFSEEEEPGLGNGGLGRLAACYLDSLAALQHPAIGYGIRYEFGIFDQEILTCQVLVHLRNAEPRAGRPEVCAVRFHVDQVGHRAFAS